MKFEIRNRFSGAVQFECEIDAAEELGNILLHYFGQLASSPKPPANAGDEIARLRAALSSVRETLVQWRDRALSENERFYQSEIDDIDAALASPKPSGRTGTDDEDVA